MPDMYHDGQRLLQERFDTRRLADALEEKLVRDTINPKQKAFIESADMFFLATADAHGRPSCSYRGGDPGFVRVVDERTLAVPNYDGNGMYLSWGNVESNPHVGLLFIDFMKGWRLRIHGRRRSGSMIHCCASARVCSSLSGSRCAKCSGTCPRYIHRYQLVERSLPGAATHDVPPQPAE
jgi:predicted pyridoxine 5'-phosphate oxidase superfamily flavin-nucleotide-binding protein